MLSEHEEAKFINHESLNKWFTKFLSVRNTSILDILSRRDKTTISPKRSNESEASGFTTKFKKFITSLLDLNKY